MRSRVCGPLDGGNWKRTKRNNELQKSYARMFRMACPPISRFPDGRGLGCWILRSYFQGSRLCAKQTTAEYPGPSLPGHIVFGIRHKQALVLLSQPCCGSPYCRLQASLDGAAVYGMQDSVVEGHFGRCSDWGHLPVPALQCNQHPPSLD
jgi:hypothetical protein